MSTFDNLRSAALAFAHAHRAFVAMKQFGAGTGRVKSELARTTRSLEQASDAHASRGRDGVVQLIIAGHSIESAKRVLALRGDARSPAPRRAFKKRAKVAPGKKRGR